MRKRRAELLFTAAAVLAASAGCSGGTRTVSVVEPTTSAVAPESIIFDWQNTYEKKLNDYKQSAGFVKGESGSMFDLCDLTGDGSPELIISPSVDTEAECRIYTCIGGNAIDIGECGVKGVFEYAPEIKTISKKYVGKTFEITEFMVIEENALATVKKFYNNRNAVSTGARLTYEVDNETVNVSEYDRQLSEFTSSSFLEIGRKYSFEDASVNYALHYSESWGPVLTDTQKELYRNVLRDQMNGADVTAAFELCDLNGDDVPELIYSEGTYPDAFCHIYKLGDNRTDEVAGAFMASDGNIFFDVDKKVYFGPQTSSVGPQSLDGGAVTGYTRTENVIVCGRKYLLNEDSLVKAFR